MKRIASITICLLIFVSLSSSAQSGFDQALNDISRDLANKLAHKEKQKVVVLYVTDINKATTVAGKYLADVISVNIVNDVAGFYVFDRENLAGITEVNKMIAEGYIDVDKAKELGKILSVEAIIIGNYTVLSNTIKLTLKALDAGNGFVIAASIKDLPLDGDAGALLGINISSPDNASIANTNRGFNNQPINSNERYNNPDTVSKDCETKKTGDYCFSNLTKENLRVKIYLDDRYIGRLAVPGQVVYLTATLAPGETQCFYDLEARKYTYFILLGFNGNTNFSNGQVSVEMCKSKTFNIK